MADTREALAKLLTEHFPEYITGTCLCGVDAPDLRSWAAHLAELIDTAHLVVPRSDIVGTEYGWRDERADHRAFGLGDAKILARLTPDPVVLSRPVLPWAPTPLPEDGDPR